MEPPILGLARDTVEIACADKSSSLNDTKEDFRGPICAIVAGSKSGSDRVIESGWRQSWPTATMPRSMCEGRSVLASAEGCSKAEIMRRAGVSKPCTWRPQRRFMEAGVDGLLHDKMRRPDFGVP